MNRFLASMPLCLCSALLAQTPPSVSQTGPPKFVVADVHASRTAPGYAMNLGGVLREGLYIDRDATLLNLINAAYGVSEDAIAGGPGWVDSDLFDVVAKVPEGTTPAAAKLMLQGLLAERFSLVMRTETRPVPRYVLSVGKVSKLKPASGSEAHGCQPKGNGALASDPAQQPNIRVTCHNLTASDIAENLHQMAGGYLDHDVLDETKLEGTYDFDLEWTGRGALAVKGADGISIFDAVGKQLGLKLELKDIPLPAFAIASVNRKPTANASNIVTALAMPQARFEVAVIKPADPSAPHFSGILYSGGSQMRAGGTLREMIAMALQITPNIGADMVVGLPKSADSDSWEITAKVPATGEGAPNMTGARPRPPPLSVALEMLRGLLLDQFEMKSHTENREVTVYALTVGPKYKLTRADDAERAGCRPDPGAPKPAANVQTMIACKNTSMGELADNLQRMGNSYIDHPIVDATGLGGGWDFVMGWTSKSQLDAAASSDGSPTGGLSVFEAMEKELGLKLVKEKRSIPVIVIDHIDEKPIE